MTALRAKLAQERGSMLVELLVAIPSALAVGGAAMALSGVFGNGQTITRERSESMQDQQVTAERMTREARQATEILEVSDRALTIRTYVRPTGGGPRALADVRFACAGTTCTRSVNGAAPTIFAEGVTNPVVFSSTQPNYVRISLEIDVPGQTTDVVVDDGVELVNAP